MIVNNFILKSCKNIKINNYLNYIIYCKNNNINKQFKRNYSNNNNNNNQPTISNNNNNNKNNNKNNINNNNNIKSNSNINQNQKEEYKVIFKKTQLFSGTQEENEIENEYKPKLLKLLRDSFGLTQIKEISNQMIESLKQCSESQIKADQDRLFFFGDLTLRHAVSDPLELPFPDKNLFREFEDTVQSDYYLRKRCQEIGLDKFIRFSYFGQKKITLIDEKNIESNRNKVEYFDQYKEIYANNNYYKCLIKFIGTLYLEYDFKLAHQFIHKVLLGLPNKQLISILLEKPETIMIKKFSLYKLESPVIKSIPNTASFPFFTTIINSGRTEVSKGYGITENESYNMAVELLNKESESLSSLMSHILKNTKDFSAININNNNNYNKNKNNKNRNK